MKRRRAWLYRLAALLPILFLVIVMLRWFEHNQVYHPDRNLRATGQELGRPFEDVHFKASDGVQLHGWFYRADTNSARSNIAVLVCHGNAGNISDRLYLCRALLATGVNVFLFDYRGFGKSEGRPGEEGTYLDAQAAHHWLTQKGFSSSNIIAFGESLGGGIASELAVREKVGGLVLQSTFSSIPDVGAELFPWLPVKWMAKIRYETHEKLPRIKVPVLVMHSRGDRLIRFHHSEKNFKQANAPKLMWELQGDHNDSVVDEQHFIAGMEKFLLLLEQEKAPKL